MTVMSKQKAHRIERRAEGVVKGLALLKALRERAQGMHARKMCAVMGLRSGTAWIGRRLAHIEDAVRTGGAAWEEVLIPSEDREPRWRAGPGIDAAIRAAQEYLEAIGPLAARPLDDETIAAHSDAEPLRLTALRTVYDRRQKPLKRGIGTFTELLENAPGIVKLNSWWSNPVITAVHAVPAHPDAAPLPEETTASGRWSAHGANGTRSGEAGAMWTDVHTVETRLVYTRRVYRTLVRKDPCAQLLRARAQVNCGVPWDWRHEPEGFQIMHCGQMREVPVGDGTGPAIQGPPPPGLGATLWWTVRWRDAQGRARTSHALLLVNELPTAEQLRSLGAIGKGGVLEACEPQHRAPNPRDRITLARETGAEALALDVLMRMAYRAGYDHGVKRSKGDRPPWFMEEASECLCTATDAIKEVIEATAGGATARMGARSATIAAAGVRGTEDK